MDKAGHAQYVTWIRELPQQLRELVEGLDEAQLTTHFLEGEWNVAQNVHHLADAHMYAFLRVKLALTMDTPSTPSFDQDQFAETVEAGGLPIENSLALLDGLQERWAALGESLSEEQLARTLASPYYGEIPVSDVFRMYSQHGLNHLDQIRATLAAQG